MTKKEAAEYLDLAQALLGQWVRYRQFYFKGISQDPIHPQEEAEFLDVTSSIAQNVRKLGDRLDEKKFPIKKQKISELIKTTISVQYFRNLPVKDQFIFRKEWHQILIYLSRTVGALKFINEGYVPPEKAKAKKKSKGGGKKVVVVVIVLAIVGAVVAFRMGLF